jgi:hypothetical protein
MGSRIVPGNRTLKVDGRWPSSYGSAYAPSPEGRPAKAAFGLLISIRLNAIIGTLSDAENYPPHRARKRQPGTAGPQEFDPASPEQFAYPADT